MKGKILLKALEFLYEGAMTQVDFFDAVLSAGYGAGAGRIEYEYHKLRRVRESKRYQAEALEDRKRRLTVFISKMKHDGLIEKLKDNKFIISFLTKAKTSSISSETICLPGSIRKKPLKVIPLS